MGEYLLEHLCKILFVCILKKKIRVDKTFIHFFIQKKGRIICMHLCEGNSNHVNQLGNYSAELTAANFVTLSA